MFFFKKKKPASRPKPAAVASPQKRSSFRMPVEFDLLYTLEGRRGRRGGKANDLSAGGLRLSCDEDLVKGSFVLLEFELPGEFLANMTIEKEVFQQSPFGLRPESIRVSPPSFAPMSIRAKVLVSFFSAEQKKFAHGISFADVDEKTQEELQRFIHLWQLNYIRTRRGEM